MPTKVKESQACCKVTRYEPSLLSALVVFFLGLSENGTRSWIWDFHSLALFLVWGRRDFYCDQKCTCACRLHRTFWHAVLYYYKHFPSTTTSCLHPWAFPRPPSDLSPQSVPSCLALSTSRSVSATCRPACLLLLGSSHLFSFLAPPSPLTPGVCVIAGQDRVAPSSRTEQRNPSSLEQHRRVPQGAMGGVTDN